MDAIWPPYEPLAVRVIVLLCYVDIGVDRDLRVVSLELSIVVGQRLSIYVLSYVHTRLIRSVI